MNEEKNLTKQPWLEEIDHERNYWSVDIKNAPENSIIFSKYPDLVFLRSAEQPKENSVHIEPYICIGNEDGKLILYKIYDELIDAIVENADRELLNGFRNPALSEVVRDQEYDRFEDLLDANAFEDLKQRKRISSVRSNYKSDEAFDIETILGGKHSAN